MLFAPLPAGAGDKKSKRTPEEQKARDLAKIGQRLKKSTCRAAADPECGFAHARAEQLLARAHQAPAKSFLFGRLESAIDDLLDAVEVLRKLDEGGKDDDDPEGAMKKSARDLERTYFRLKQGEYFVKFSGEDDGAAYAAASQRLYQRARKAYDQKDYRRARRYGEAARELINGLENLAQAAAPLREPPRLGRE